MNKYIYISYSQKDSDFANQLTSRLFKYGINTWFDKTEIEAGENWQKKIDDGLSNASVLLFIASKNSINSKWTNYEINKFLEKGGRVITLIIDDDAINTLPEFLKKFQYIDFRSSLKNLSKLINALEKLNINKNQKLVTPKIKSKGYVFLSYCEEDKPFVATLKDFLKTNGYAYWDYEESDRDYHNQLFIELEDAIKDASATLSILSPFWKLSKWSLKEYFFSEEVGTPVFLLKAQALDPTLAIAGIPFIDFTLDMNYGFEKLSRELNRKNL
jgi:hypothetical protein